MGLRQPAWLTPFRSQIIVVIAIGTRREKWINQNNMSPPVCKQDELHALEKMLPGPHRLLVCSYYYFYDI